MLQIPQNEQTRLEFLNKHPDFEKYTNQSIAKGITLRQWNERMIYPYDNEAIDKNWVTTAFQDTLGTIWDIYQKSMVWAPREHLKTHTALSYILKRVYEREYPLEINYYHISGDLAREKFRKMQRIVENNPLMADNFDIKHAVSWSEEKMQLSDGTLIVPWSYQSGSVGKHPHIIVLDDIIDWHVIYSDVLNDKAIVSFFTNIYPQISKPDPTKKIIIIGTAQRKNDLYNKLPADFAKHRYQAITDEFNKQVLSPEIFTYEHLMKIKHDISENQGERFWMKEYMNIPFEAAGLIVKPEWIQYYSDLSKDIIPFMPVYQGWDLSVGKDIEKGDWTVGCTIRVDRREADQGGKINIFVEDVYRARIDFGTRVDMVNKLYHEKMPVAVGVESVAFQYDTIQHARSRYGLPITEVKAIMNKIQSFQVELGPYFENKQIYIKSGQPWTDSFVNELLSLPVGEHDDQADGLKIAIKTALFNSFGSFPNQEIEQHGTSQTREVEHPIFADLQNNDTIF